MSSQTAPTASRDRLLPWIAAERAFRAIVLLTVGVVLLTHPNTDWGSEISHLAQRLGLNPNGNGIRWITQKVARIHAHQEFVFGIAAVAYGVLEGAEAYGLWRARRWGEWLTVVATSLLFIPEIWELTRSTTFLKVGALLANIAIVAYLLWRLRGSPRPPFRAGQ